MGLKSERHNIAIIGINKESANLLPVLIQTGRVNILRIINPQYEDIIGLQHYRDLDVIVDTTNDSSVASVLRSLDMPHVDIISGLSARILFVTGKNGLFYGEFSDNKERILSSLQEIREAILLSKNKEELLKLILTVAIRFNGADSGSIMLLDAGTRSLTIEMADGLSPEVVTSTVQKVGKGIAGKVVTTKEPVIIKGAVGKGMNIRGYERKDIVSSICCPLIIEGDAVGAISINSKTKEKVFTEDDLAYIKKLAEFTADIICTSKEYEQSSSSTLSLALIDNARKILNLNYSFDERLNLLLMRIENSVKGEICNYYSYNADSKSFFVKASSSFKVGLLRGKVLKLNAYLTKKILASMDTVTFQLSEQKANIKKWYIAHPIRVSGELAGLLFLHMISDRTNCNVEKQVIQKIGDMIAAEFGKDIEKESFRMKTMKFSAISEASFDLASGGSRYELAKIIVANACLILEAESSILRIINKKTGALDVWDSFSLGNSSHLKEVHLLDEAIAHDTFVSKQIMLINDLQAFPKYSDRNFGSRSVLCMRLEKGGKPLGTLSLYDKKSLDFFGQLRFSESDKEVFVNFCLQVSKALARLVQ